MIRTGVVNLTTIPAVAYRKKLKDGGSGVVILRNDASQPGLATISRSSGEAILADNTLADTYPVETFNEAIELTAGMPYRKLGGVKHANLQTEDEPDEPADVIVDSAEYQEIVMAYSDRSGKFSYDLLNREMIKFIGTSKEVPKMIAEMASEEAIRLYVAGVKFRDITGNHDMTDEQVQKIIEMLDEIDPKGVLREFNEEVRKALAATKQNRQ